MVTIVNKSCLVCEETFKSTPYSHRKFCSRKCYFISMKGENNSKWRGGRYNNHGYEMIYSPNHPFHDKNGYVMEHRIVMEKSIGRVLKHDERVHHLNGIKTDNRIENLILFTSQSEHRKFELKHFTKNKRGQFVKFM